MLVRFIVGATLSTTYIINVRGTNIHPGPGSTFSLNVLRLKPDKNTQDKVGHNKETIYSQRICTAGELSEGEIRVLECWGAAVHSLALYRPRSVQRVGALVLNIYIVAQNLTTEDFKDSCDQSKKKYFFPSSSGLIGIIRPALHLIPGEESDVFSDTIVVEQLPLG